MKKYTLGEIGVFFRLALIEKRDSDVASLNANWLAHHVSQKGLNTILKDMRMKAATKTERKAQEAPKEVEKQWKSFAMAFRKLNRRG